MAYFRNSTVNLLTLHYAIYSLAANAGGIFVAVYLLRAGVPLATIFVAMALIFLGRFAVRPLVLAVGKQTGLRLAVMLGTIGTGLQYALVAFVHGVDLALLAYCVVSAVADAFYWTAFHAYFASVGDEEHRGQQTSAREALGTIVGIAAPLLGGWSLVTFGPGFAFLAVAGIQMLAAVPFFFTPNVGVVREAPNAYRAARFAMLLGAADGWMYATFGLAWQVMLFLSLGSNLLAFGGAMALAAIAGAAAGLLLGRVIDLGHGRRAVSIACGAMAIAAVTRATSSSFPVLAIAANALGTFAMCVYVPTAQSPIYNEAKSAPCALRYNIATEGAADIGFAVACLLVAGFVVIGLPLWFGVLLSLFANGASFLILRRYYPTRSPVAPVPFEVPADSLKHRFSRTP